MATAAQRNWEERQRQMSEEQRRLARQQAFADNVRLAQQEMAMRAYESSIVSTATFQADYGVVYQPISARWFNAADSGLGTLSISAYGGEAPPPLVEDDYNI